LFLLELSHTWGPALRTAPTSSALIGFPYHWSFFSGLPSPAGGNAWTDNGDGTFTVVPGTPLDVKYTMLDLYVMGLADPGEVKPFYVLENPTVPSTPTDPLWQGPFAAHSFPWFDQSTPPLTVSATKTTFTIDDIIAANGPRSPAPNTKTELSIAFVLMVPESATDAEIAQAEAVFDPIAEQFAPAFAEAVSNRGSLDVLTLEKTDAGTAGSGGTGGTSSDAGKPYPIDEAGVAASGGKPAQKRNDDSDGGCSTSPRSTGDRFAFVLFALALSRIVRRRRR
jgi:MYXO-CTERM domain-containing protein